GGARRRRGGVGRTGGRSRASVRSAGGGERRPAGAGADRLRRPYALVPRAAADDAPAARARALRGAGGAWGSHDRTACRAAGRRRCRTFGAGRPARLEPGERGAGREGGAATAGTAARRDARVPGGGRQRADAPARARGVARPPARPAGTRGTAAAEARSLGAARRRRLVAPDGDAARAH